MGVGGGVRRDGGRSWIVSGSWEEAVFLLGILGAQSK